MNYYEIVGKYVDNSNTIIAYALRNIQSGDVENFLKESVYFMLGRKQIVNCKASLSNGKVVLSGVNCDLNLIPTKAMKENGGNKSAEKNDSCVGKKVENTSGSQEMKDKSTFKTKSSVRNKIATWQGYPTEIALYYGILKIIANRDIQCVSLPSNHKYESSDDLYKNGYRYKVEMELYFKKLNDSFKIEIIALKDSQANNRTKVMYLLKVFNDKKVYIETNVKPYETIKSPVTSLVGYGSSSAAASYVVSAETTGDKISQEFFNRMG